MDSDCHQRDVQDFLLDSKTPHELRFGEPFDWLVIPFGSMSIIRSLPETSQDSTSFVRKFCLESSSDMQGMLEVSGKETSWSRTFRSWKFWTRQNPCSKTRCEGGPHAEQWRTCDVPDRRWNSHIVWKRSGLPNIHLNPGLSCTRRRP